MRTSSRVSVLTILAACGGGADVGGDTDAPSRFEELVFVDDEGVETTGDFSGFTPGADWASTDWLTQSADAAKQVPVSVESVTEDFEGGEPVDDLDVAVWFDDVVDGAPDLTASSDESGLVTIDAIACTPTAYRVTGDPVVADRKTTYKAHHVYPFGDAGAVTGGLYLSVSSTTYELIPTILGVVVDPDKAVIAGTAFDVRRDPSASADDDAGKVEGAQIVVYDAAGDIPDTLVVNYFTDGFPDRDQRWTSADGLWVASNVPPGELRVEMWGNVGGALTLLGATVLQSEPDSINIANVYAGYGDGVKLPADCLAP